MLPSDFLAPNYIYVAPVVFAAPRLAEVSVTPLAIGQRSPNSLGKLLPAKASKFDSAIQRLA
jgi:hypothetical protein